MTLHPLAPGRPDGWPLVLLIVGVLAALAVLAGPAPAQAAPRTLTAKQLASDAPKTVLIDAKTGQITESWLSTAAELTAITQRSTCNPGDGCLISSAVPYADYGFYGSAGTKTGSWDHRKQVLAGNYSVRACWGSTCTPRLAPHTQAVLSTVVTATSFRIY